MMFFGSMLLGNLFADPCGMVPPVAVTSSNAIARTGIQRTYVFHKDGIETIALRKAMWPLAISFCYNAQAKCRLATCGR